MLNPGTKVPYRIWTQWTEEYRFLSPRISRGEVVGRFRNAVPAVEGCSDLK
jgi:hypothetical protein